jgi:arginine deiminase
MPPKKDADKNQKILDFNVGDEQPPWAKNMENRLSEKFDQVASSVAILETRLEHVEREAGESFKKLQDQMTDFEFHQRKYNLLFFGLPDEMKPAETRVKEFLDRELQIDSASMVFQNCHPLPAGRGTRPVIARFLTFADRDKVLKSLPKLKGKNLKVTVMTDLPKELRQKRSELQRQMKAMKSADNARILRVAERGQSIRIEEKEKKTGKWISVK